MDPSPSPAVGARHARRVRLWPLWLIGGLTGWAGVVALGSTLFGSVPSRAGFDLRLLLEAGQRVAAGASPYDPAFLAGGAPTAVDLFYSYPPPVAQYLALFAAVSTGTMLVALGVVAVLGLAAISHVLARFDRRSEGATTRSPRASVVLSVIATAPFVFPFAIAILFGNLDVLFPLLYGLMMLGALSTGLPARFAGGFALAIAAVAKLHPGSMGIWFAVRGLRERRQSRAGIVLPQSDRLNPPAGWIVLAGAVAVGLTIVILSLLTGGPGPWQDYVQVLRIGSGADFVDSRNVGPAAQIALLTGSGEDLARAIQVGVALVAVAGMAAVAWALEDTVESFGWAAVASLVVLPVTWFHYPVALIPLALVAWLRADPRARARVLGAIGGAIGVGILAVAMPVLIWLAVALVMMAVRWSIPMALSLAMSPGVAGAGATVPSEALVRRALDR